MQTLKGKPYRKAVRAYKARRIKGNAPALTLIELECGHITHSRQPITTADKIAQAGAAIRGEIWPARRRCSDCADGQHGTRTEYLKANYAEIE